VTHRLALVVASLLTCLGAGGMVCAENAGQQLAQSAGSSIIGTPAPPLKLVTIDGKPIDLSALYGHKAVYLKFWATWCVPCRQQMPHFERVFESAGADLAVVAVNAGFNDSLQEVRSYRQAMGLKMPIVIDDGRLADALHLRVTPQHVVIGRSGRVEYIGHLVDAHLEEALRTAREEPARAAVSHAAPPRLASYRIGDAVSTGALQTIGGGPMPITDPARRKVTVLMFLSPWCESYLAESRPERSAACRRAREQSEQLARGSGLRWIGIASGLWATADDLVAYRTEKHVTIPISLDESGTLFRRFAVADVPTFIVVDSGGRLVRRIDRVDAHLAEQLSGSAASAGQPHP
jgi:thiol-disulfide isomerase/thioredoxin